MIEVKVGGLIPDKKTGSHVLLLKVPHLQRYLPIWIGLNEANAIALALRNQSFDRPLTHDLLKSVIDGLGASVSRVVITTIQDNTFYARIFLTREHEILSIDARPSDSVALAVRAGCPIFLTEELLASQEDNLYELQEESGEEGSAEEGETRLEEGLDELLRKVEKGESEESPLDEDPMEEDEDEDEDEEDEEEEQGE